MRIRGGLTLAAEGVLMVGGDVIQRLVIAPLVRVFPQSREKILTSWSHTIAGLTLTLLQRFGGAKLTDRPRLAAGPDMLILMNHQSVLDVPIVWTTVQGTYPRIVTRRRYASGKPLISHMLKLGEQPVVDPGTPSETQFKELESVGREARHPVVVFPEGHRSKDGEIGSFKTGALRAFLAQRVWSVHLLVGDGMWKHAKLVSFLENVSHINARVTALGPFRSPEPGQDPNAFIEELRAKMIERLAGMRYADPALPPSPELRAIMTKWATSMPLSSEVTGLVEAMVRAAPRSTAAVLFFGSQLAGTNPGRHSAYDFVVIVDDLKVFYGELASAGFLRRSATFVTLLNRILAPNVISFRPFPDEGPGAKCIILDRAQFDRAVSGEAPDYFLLGRFSQRVAIAWARDDAMRSRLVDALATCVRLPVERTRVFFSGPFATDGFAETAIAASYAAEIRPENASRSLSVVEAQRPFFREVYGQVLEEAVKGGLLVRGPEGFSYAIPVSDDTRARTRRYFRRSKRRATMRWFKYILTFDDWLDYLVRKVERRTGLTVTITPMERRFPLLLLWPKFFRVMRQRTHSRETVGGPPA